MWAFAPLLPGGAQLLSGAAGPPADTSVYDSAPATATALALGYGDFGFSLQIEGYEYILTDAASTSAVVTAFSGSGWTQALPGLKVRGQVRQSIKPWDHDVDVPVLEFAIQPNDADTFGKAVWKTKPTYSSDLTAVYQPSTTGTGTITVRDQTDLPASGEVYIGGTRHSYSALSGTTQLTVSAADTYQPFTADSGLHYSRPYTPPAGVNGDIAPPPRVTDIPTKWIGRKVALRIHSIAGGKWATYSDAQVEFAGRISAIREDEDGHTILQCEDLRADIRDAVLMKTQWRGFVKNGVRLVAGMRFWATEHQSSGGATESALFEVVASGAAGTTQINEGYVELDELLSSLNSWVANDATLTGDWSIGKATGGEGGTRVRIGWKKGATTMGAIALSCSHKYPLDFMGFTDIKKGQPMTVLSGRYYAHSPEVAGQSTGAIVGEKAPYRCKFLQSDAALLDVVTLSDGVVDLDSTDGTWFNQTSQLPVSMQSLVAAGENWGFVQVGKMTCLAKYVDSNTLSSFIGPGWGVLKYIEGGYDHRDDGLTIDDENDKLEVKQIVILQDTLVNLLTKLVASTDGRGVNHANYDVLPWGAGIPYSLLGATWIDSIAALEQTQLAHGGIIVIDRPTRLLDLLTPELALRFAWLIWKSEGYRLVSPATPSTLTADWTLTEANKAQPAGDIDEGRAISEVTNDYIRNLVKVEYARGVDGKYHKSITVKDQASIDEYGEQAITISAPSAMGEQSESGTAVESMAVNLSTRALPHWAKPLKTLRRTIAPSLYGICPGDSVSVSDNFARDPDSGQRGIATRAGIVTDVAHDFGHEGGQLYGEVTVLFVDEDRAYPLSPACEIDGSYTSGLYTNGYDSTNFRLRIKDHQFSRSTDATDLNNFAAGDLVRIIEWDPTNTASPDAWSRTIASVSSASSYIQLTAAISSPAWSGTTTKRIVMIPQAYASVQASQQDFAFQADDADGFIQDLIGPNVLADGPFVHFATSGVTAAPNLLADEFYGDGKPFTSAHQQSLALMLNNLASYKMAPTAPWAANTIASTNRTFYTIAYLFPFPVGGIVPAGYLRYLFCAPTMRTTNAAATASVRITSSRHPPILVNGANTWQGPVQQLTFTSATATWGEATEQGLLPIRGMGIPNCTWITIEYKISNGTYNCETRGPTRLYLGPLELQ